MFQQEYPYGFSFMETSLSYYQNVVVSGFDDITSQSNPFSSSSLATLISSSIEEQQFHSNEKLSSGEELPPKRRKRRRKTRSDVNKIEVKEKQRMNHIAIERNRRRQMNDFLFILKSMMPLSYSQRSDQASIIEGTINYLKKQEQLLQSLQATKPINQSPKLFSDFFLFPQYSTASSNNRDHEEAVADVEVTMMERHANIKVVTKTRPRLLFKIVNEFNYLGLRILHLNLTTSQGMSLFTFCVKVEEECQLTTTANEVANAVHEVIRRIHKEN